MRALSSHTRRAAVALDFQPVVGEFHARRQLRLRDIVIVVVGQVGEIRPAGIYPPGGRQCLVQIHVCGMRRAPQCIQHDDFHARQFFHHFARHLLAIAQVGQPLLAVLREQVTVGHRLAMRQRQRGDLQVAEREWPVHNVRFRHEITARPRPVVKRVGVHALQRRHRFLARVDGQLPVAQVAKAPAIVQPHHMVRVGVREYDRVQPADVFAQNLRAKIRRRVHRQLDAFRGHVNRRTRPVILRIGQKCRRIIHADQRHALRRPRTQKCKCK